MKSRHFSKAFPLAAAMLLLTLACDGFHCSAADITPDRLSCEYSQAPLGIDVLQPRLNWIVTSQERAQLQKAYQILVSSSEASLKKDQGELWDTGKVPSGETLHIVYSGKPLTSRHRCFWKVRVWDKTGKASDWSSSGWWEMGLLQNSAGQGSSTLSGWTAKWIARTTDTNSNPAPLFRRVFNLSGQVKKARAYISGLGYYELHINGKKIGDHLLDPGYTRYDKRVLYATYDVTDALRSGRNAIGIILGNGWYNVHTVAVWDFQKAPWRASPRVLMQLDVEYSDGRTETIVTDGDWKTSTGPITFDSIYGGQTYDARQEKPEWATPAYDDSAWLRALEVEPPKGKLSAQMMPPIRVDTTIKPVKLTEPKPGTFIVDFGQNFAGFAELNL
ncbi:MAG TPA: alpha-L-rhamnosidase N-terminal domain-containing protein, partial [Candidatus Dormibacteraeota bacterium]|nr:alpha-L-rhamnosidase N-terminal domain-containing protein [Candidatus Dormibacteraeota bacterium]